MNRAGHEQTTFFIGPEVEHTPAYSKKTLFVVGEQVVSEIIKLARHHKATHIFMGANHSFAVGAAYWDETITALLDQGFWVTLDYQAHLHSEVLKMLNPGIWQSRLFVPLLSVRIPKVETSSPNLTIKIDDVDFKATNPGVWCMHFHEVTDSNRFTDWNDYSTDYDVSGDVAAPMPPIVKPTVAPAPTKKVEISELKAAPVATPVLNDASLGLDPGAPSQLKPEDDEVKVPAEIAQAIQTKQDVADLYSEATAEGTSTAKKTTTKKNK